ncbi:hypothetical protein HDU97_004949 [Phlyctochytrium planicorne]|nr:hypothetical protein HDU97_004949 [Phlyctochytrium planicorne]
MGLVITAIIFSAIAFISTGTIAIMGEVSGKTSFFVSTSSNILAATMAGASIALSNALKSIPVYPNTSATFPVPYITNGDIGITIETGGIIVFSLTTFLVSIVFYFAHFVRKPVDPPSELDMELEMLAQMEMNSLRQAAGQTQAESQQQQQQQHRDQLPAYTSK